MIKVYKIICSTHTKISTPTIFFFDLHQNFVGPHDPCHQRYLTENRKDNELTTAELQHRYFPWKYPRFWELILDDLFQSYLNRQKTFQSCQCNQKFCRNWCHFNAFIIISRYTAWLELSETVPQRAYMKKVFLKIS